MPASYVLPLNAGFRRPVRFRRGEGANKWGSKINDLAHRFDAMDVSPDVAALLRELFEEIGQLAKNVQAL